MAETLGSGVVIGFGATHARHAVAENGDIIGADKEPTPQTADAFFGWIGMHILEASHAGHNYVVVGLPGPVRQGSGDNSTIIGPLANVKGMKDNEYEVRRELSKVDTAVNEILDDKFTLIFINNGGLAALAVAIVFGRDYKKVASLINGTGFGAGVAERDQDQTGVFRVVDLPIEVGHLVQGVDGVTTHRFDPSNTLENRISGTAIQKRDSLHRDPRDIPGGQVLRGESPEVRPDPIWEEVGSEMGATIVNLGLLFGVELVVPTGGVGTGAKKKYGHHLADVIFRSKGEQYGPNATQRLHVPDVKFVDPIDGDFFELRGGEGVMLDHLSMVA